MPTALGSERSRQPARLAARRTVGANDGAGPSPKPTLEPRRNFDGSIALIVSRPLAARRGCVSISAAVSAAAVAPAPIVGGLAELELELPLLEPQPASSSAPASSANARRAHTPLTLEARRAIRPLLNSYSSSCRKRSTSACASVLSAST